MNPTPCSIELLAPAIAEHQNQENRPPTVARTSKCIVHLQGCAPYANPCLQLAFTSKIDRVGEFWEAVSYILVWLCGLASIGLCLF